MPDEAVRDDIDQPASSALRGVLFRTIRGLRRDLTGQSRINDSTVPLRDEHAALQWWEVALDLPESASISDLIVRADLVRMRLPDAVFARSVNTGTGDPDGSEHLSVDLSWAHNDLYATFGETADELEWRMENERRFDLIRKKVYGRLKMTEEAELARLQSEADNRIHKHAARDTALLDELERAFGDEDADPE